MPTWLLVDRTIQAVCEEPQAARLRRYAFERDMPVRVIDRNNDSDGEPLCGLHTDPATDTSSV